MKDWELFLAECTDVFVAKNTDYDSRFMKALVNYAGERGMEAARTIWAWEVEKKLDRCRTWIMRGQLLVKDEGVRNSVVDLFNYTVQYSIFFGCIQKGQDPFPELTESRFFYHAAQYQASDWIEYLRTEKLLRPDESRLLDLLLEEMTGVPF